MAGNAAYYSSAQLRNYKNGYRGQLKYKDEHGKWKSVSKVLDAKGKRAAQKELEAWQAEMESKAAFYGGMIQRPDNVGAFVEQYIDTLEALKTVQPSTIASYRAYLKPIKQGLGHIPFEELDVLTTEAWVKELNKKYAPTSVKRYLNLLKAAYNDLKDKHQIPYNPIDSVSAPKIESKTEHNSLDATQRARLLSYLDIAENTPTNLAIKLATFTGMREAEICGLQWKNLDFEHGILKVRQVIGHDGGKTYVKQPKTKNSRRSIPLPEDFVPELVELHGRFATECAKAGIKMKPSHYVFGQVDGSYMAPHELWRSWRAIAKSLGLVGQEGKTPTFHDLRHTYATAAIAAGADVKTVSSTLGHHSAAMTLDMYASSDEDAKKQGQEKTYKELTKAPKQAEILALGKTGTEN